MAIKVHDIKIIQIMWDGPKTIEEVKKCNEDYDCGVYQIYGPHPVYGENVLIYIGEVGGKEDSERTFSIRIEEHKKKWLNDNLLDSRYGIFLGRLMGNKAMANKVNDKTWSKEIKIAEAMLIACHLPAYNARDLSISEAKDEEIRDYHLINWGNMRSLMPEMSAARLTYSFWSRRGLGNEDDTDKDIIYRDKDDKLGLMEY